jgi:hypothetical protein
MYRQEQNKSNFEKEHGAEQSLLSTQRMGEGKEERHQQQ